MKSTRTHPHSVIILLLVLGLVLAGCSKGSQTPTPQSTAPTTATTPTQGGTLVIATQADPATMDPHNTGDIPSEIVQMHIFETLVTWTDKGEIAPGLATDWTWSQDGLTLTMHLKQGVKFHDGSAFNAGVVKYNFDRILDPKNSLRSRATFASIKQVDAPDDNTVIIHLSETNGPLMSALAATLGAIVSKDAIEKYGKDIALHPVGTGPFKFVRWDTKQQIVVEANPDYAGGRPHLDQIIFKPVPDQQARVAMLEAGDAQIAAPVPLQDVERLKADPRFAVEAISGMDNLHMPLNTLQKPLDDVRVRQALNYAVDKEALVKTVYLGYAKALNDSPLAPAMFGYQPVGEYYTYDVAKAKQLMADAGYANGFKMIVWIPDGRYMQDRRVGEAVSGYLKEIGVTVELQTYEWATYVDKLLSGSPNPPPEYGAVMISFADSTRDADRGLSSIYASDQFVPNGFNMCFYSNKKVDDALVRGRQANDPKVRLQAYAEAGKQIMEDAPVIFLVTYQFVAARSAKVHGMTLDPNGGVTAMNAWIEK